MYIQSVNIAEPKTIFWNNKQISTGIYKSPTPKPIFLGRDAVKDDYIADKKVHGGEYKACYLFSSDHYPYWKNLYPNLKWNWGMFGENLTINGLNETQVMVGDIYKIGDALVQITQPREPCFKFGVKFGSQHVLKQFIDHGFSGTYVKVLEEGLAHTKDTLKLINRLDKSLSVAQLFNLIFSKEKDKALLKTAVMCEAIPQYKRDTFAKLL